MSGPPEHAVRCPWCLAPAGQRCTTPRGRKLAVPSHDARRTAWAGAFPATDRRPGQRPQAPTDLTT